MNKLAVAANYSCSLQLSVAQLDKRKLFERLEPIFARVKSRQNALGLLYNHSKILCSYENEILTTPTEHREKNER